MEDRTQDFGNTLENGLQVLCEAMGVHTERYDTDQADTECFMDCFREAAELINRAGFIWDAEEGEFAQKESSRSPVGSIADLREALEDIRDMDARKMYGTCPDCWRDECSKTQTCGDTPYSQIGKRAIKALGN